MDAPASAAACVSSARDGRATGESGATESGLFSTSTSPTSTNSRTLIGVPSIDAGLASLDGHVAVGLDGNLPAALDDDVLALQLDRSVLLHQEAGVTSFERNRIAGLDDELLAHLQRVVLADARPAPAGHRLRLVAADGQGCVRAYLGRVARSNGDGLTRADGDRLIRADAGVLIRPDRHRLARPDRHRLKPPDGNLLCPADADCFVDTDGVRPLQRNL